MQTRMPRRNQRIKVGMNWLMFRTSPKVTEARQEDWRVCTMPEIEKQMALNSTRQWTWGARTGQTSLVRTDQSADQAEQ